MTQTIMTLLLLFTTSPNIDTTTLSAYCQNVMETLPADEVERELKANNLSCKEYYNY